MERGAVCFDAFGIWSSLFMWESPAGVSHIVLSSAVGAYPRHVPAWMLGGACARCHPEHHR